MSNLKALGVYQCQLIHIGDTLRLLEIVRKGRESSPKRAVTLDFYPRFHVGPVPIPNDDNYTGSYGVTWNNSRIDSRLAIWCLVARSVRQSRHQGAGLFNGDGAFKLWLEKSPCWRIDDTLIALCYQRDPLLLATQLDFPNTKGNWKLLNFGSEW
jgi:hypothetical protein